MVRFMKTSGPQNAMLIGDVVFLVDKEIYDELWVSPLS